MSSAASAPRPAPETKDVRALSYQLWPAQDVVTLRQDNGLNDTTGSTLWLGAQVLAIYLEKAYRDVRPLRCIELGAGTGASPDYAAFAELAGLVSLKLASLGFDVIASDMRGSVQAILNANLTGANIRRPHWGSVDIAVIDWTEPIPADVMERMPFDLLVAADVVFANDAVEPLLATMSALCADRTPILLALERRDPQLVDSFFAAARDRHGFACTRIGHSRIKQLMAGLDWAPEDWSAVEIWKLRKAAK